MAISEAEFYCPACRWAFFRFVRRISGQEPACYSDGFLRNGKQAVAEAFCVSWDRVYEAVKQAVSWGLAHRDLSGIEAIGVDEVQWLKCGAT